MPYSLKNTVKPGLLEVCLIPLSFCLTGDLLQKTLSLYRWQAINKHIQSVLSLSLSLLHLFWQAILSSIISPPWALSKLTSLNLSWNAILWLEIKFYQNLSFWNWSYQNFVNLFSEFWEISALTAPSFLSLNSLTSSHFAGNYK